jgi:hypothetical protein
MNRETVAQGIGKILSKQIRLADGLTLSSAYESTDILVCNIWQGDSETVLSSPSVYWNQTLGPPNFIVDLEPADTSSLIPAVYWIGVVATRPSTSQTAKVWESQIEVTSQPGTTLPQPVYIQLEDLMIEMPSISDYQQQFRDLTGFAGQRARARRELDELVHRNVRGVAGITSSVYPADFPYRFLIKSPILVKYLEQNYLWLTQPFIDHQVFITLSYIFRGQIPGNPDLFSRLALDYKVRAELALRACTGQLMGPQNDGTGAGTGDGVLLALVDFSSSKILRS